MGNLKSWPKFPIREKFHLGPPPDDPKFDPAAEGWTGIREPGPIGIQLISLPVALIIFFGFLFFLASIWPAGPEQDVSSIGLLLILVLTIPAHELLHAICFPGGLRSPNTIIGFWPGKLLFYAGYLDEQNRDQLLRAVLAPLFGLTFVPLVIIVLFQWPSLELAILSLFNGVLASGDIVIFFLIIFQIPVQLQSKIEAGRFIGR